MPNITVSVADDVYRAARIRAAERGTSVSALVGEFLRDLSAADAEFRRLEARRREIVKGINPNFRASDNIPRDELYDRGVR